jgi:hypothetical protein
LNISKKLPSRGNSFPKNMHHSWCFDEATAIAMTAR